MGLGLAKGIMTKQMSCLHLVVGGKVIFSASEPRVDFLERPGVGDIVDEDGHVHTTVVHGGDGSESFLAGGIPQDKFNQIAIFSGYLL